MAEYWIVNLMDDVVEVHADPAGGRYRTLTTHGPDATLAPREFPDVTVRVADLIP